MTRQLKESEYNRLKVATRQLIKNCGGVESASNFTRVKHAQLGVYQNINAPEQFAPIDVIADLEEMTGTHAVTQALCTLAGGYFMPIPNIGHNEPRFAAHLAHIGKEIADVMAKSGEALIDGELSEVERCALTKEIDDAIASLAAARGFLQEDI